MTARSHTGALVAGLILIFLGILFLVENLYAPFSLWRFFERYWPLILIGIGIKGIYRYFTWQEKPFVRNEVPSKE
jgi:putative Mn2+ efflux pump MntP